MDLLHPDKKIELLTGMIMTSLRGRYDGSKVAELVKKIYDEEAKND